MPKSVVDKYWLRAVGLLAPLRCHWCDSAGAGGPACAACKSCLPWNESACRCCALPLVSAASGVCAACLDKPPPQDQTWAAFRYQAPVPQQIIGLKFKGRLAPAHVLGTLMAEKLAARSEPLPELLIPAPLHHTRLRRRGYNQALQLARELARRLSIALGADAARRLRPTQEQTRLSAVERRRNVRGVFEVNESVRDRHIALLDDVITTGATMAELARMARKAGAARIEVWAAARAV